MRRSRRRKWGCLLLIILTGVAAIEWHLLDRPPLLLLLKYGVPPAGGPTGRYRTVEGMKFVELAPGYFQMGSTRGAKDGDILGRLAAPLGIPIGEHPKPGREGPVRWVEIVRPFWVATTETTNLIFTRFDPEFRPRDHSPGDRHPATGVSRDEAEAFCEWLSGRSEGRFRLPTEAEWEYACRAGTTTRYCFGDEEGDLGEYAWFSGNSGGDCGTIGSRKPNQWGLLDMHGNAYEWCGDSWHPDYTGAPDRATSRREEGALDGVCRGGCWDFEPVFCRSADRLRYFPGVWTGMIGVRPVATFPEVE